jgi:hypothetical protein
MSFTKASSMMSPTRARNVGPGIGSPTALESIGAPS